MIAPDDDFGAPRARQSTDAFGWTRKAGLALALGAGLVSICVLLLGWIAGSDALVRLMPAYPAMVPETATGIAIGAAATVSLFLKRGGPFPPVSAALILLIVGLAIVAPTRPDLFRETDAMSLATMIDFGLLAGAILQVWTGRRRGTSTRGECATAGLAVTTVPLLGYIFDASSLFGNPVYTAMALHTALCFAALFVALLLCAPQRGCVGVLLAPEHGSQLTRRILPVVTLAPVVLCAFALEATYREIVTADFRLALLATLMIASNAAAVIGFAHVTNRAERRSAAVAAALRESERARQASELATARAQKIEALGQLVGGVAHDFNNTLMVILGNLELLEEDPDPSTRKTYVSEAIDGARHAAHLTSQLLAYGRKSRLEPEIAILDDLMPDALTMFRRVCPANIDLVTDFDAGGARVRIDVDTLKQALLNLLINARDAMPDGGRITVETQRAHRDSAMVQGVQDTEMLPAGAYVSITVRDTGPGMTADVAARASEPFFTTKGVGEGTGLGLSMVAGFCRQSGGGLAISSREGHGAAVSMIFREHEGEPRSARVADSVTLPETERSILIVDDDAHITRIMTRQLAPDGHIVRTAPDAESALAILANEAERPALVITDIVMPGPLQGHELAARIRRLYPDIALILMSGYDSASRREAQKAHKDMPFLQKPIDRATLRAAVASALDGRAD